MLHAIVPHRTLEFMYDGVRRDIGCTNYGTYISSSNNTRWGE